MSTSRQYLIALGGNLPSTVGEPRETIGAALLDLAATGITVDAVSRMFHSPCFPVGAGPDYVNAAAKIRCELAPFALLEQLHKIEAQMGRERVIRWGRRTLDMDLLAECGGAQTVLPDRETYLEWQQLSVKDQARLAPDQLILPHPRMQDRAFVLIPLLDIASEWVHPVIGLSVAEMHAKLQKSDREQVTSLS